jgi:hypothetical protein
MKVTVLFIGAPSLTRGRVCHLSLGTSRHIASGPTPRKAPSYIVVGVFTDPLHSNRRPVARVGSRGNVFTESLPSSGSIRSTI